MQDRRKAVWSIPYVSVAYHSSKVSSRADCIFEIHQVLVGCIPIAAVAVDLNVKS